MQNLSKRQLQLYRKLRQKKYRKEFGLFIAEGRKTVLELLDSAIEIQALIQTKSAFLEYGLQEGVPCFEISETEMKSISLQSNSDGILAIAEIPKAVPPEKQNKILFCDSINDPGNLGSMIRLAEWFAVDYVCTSTNSVDLYNPKVVQSARGSLFRMCVVEECGLNDLKRFKTDGFQIIGAEMEGVSIQKMEIPVKWVLLMGSESHGPSKLYKDEVNSWVHIPKGSNQVKTDSLNVTHAAAILLAKFSGL